MKIKIGDKIYSSDDQPIMVILSDNDKANISNMFRRDTKYCQYNSKKHHYREISLWMDEEVPEDTIDSVHKNIVDMKRST